MLWEERKDNIPPIFFADSQNEAGYWQQMGTKILRGAEARALVATHLLGLERLTPCPLHSTFSEIFGKQCASPSRPKRGRHISGQGPGGPLASLERPSGGRGLATPALRVSHPERPSIGLPARAYSGQTAFCLDPEGPPPSPWGQALASGLG